jgi:hypothetical protein
MKETRQIVSTRFGDGPWSAVALVAGSLFVAGCGDQFRGSGPTGPTPPPSEMSSLTWVITDNCSDGKGLQVRFHDRTYGGLWPSRSEVYVVPSRDTRERTLSCRSGANVCYGARTDPPGSNYWGVDIDGSKSCDTCCTACRDASVARTLTCD